MRRRNLLTPGMLALLLWAFSVVGAYYVVHKPFAGSNVVAFSRTLAGLGGAAVVMASGTGLGLLIAADVDLDGSERLIWSAAIGLGVLSLIGLLLGTARLLHRWVLWLVTLVILAFTGRLLWSALREAAATSLWRPRDRLERLLFGYCAFTLAVGLIWSLTPATAWDGLVYHLTGPKLYLAAGRIVHPFDLPYLGFPQLTEMLFTWAMGLAGERAAAPVHWFYGVLTVLALVAAGRRRFGASSGWLAAGLLLSARSVVLLLGWPYVDMALLFYTTLAFLALDRWMEQGEQKWLILDGVLIGLALSVKYTALAVLPALGVALLTFQPSIVKSPVRTLQSSVRSSLLLGATALLVWSPWLIKNLFLTRNPTYPFFFQGIYWDDWRGWWYDRPGTGLVYTAPARLLTAPWDATIWGVEGGIGYSASVGPLLLALAPLLFLIWGYLPSAERHRLRAAGTFSVLLYGFWLWGVARTALLQQTRLLLPAFGTLSLIVGVAIERLEVLPRRPLDLRWMVRAIIVVALVLTSIGTLLSAIRGQPLRVLLGFESREDFLERRLGWYYPAIEYLNEELSPDSVVLFLWEPRSYHCDICCRPDALLDRWLHTVHLHGHDPENMANAWRADGITHILLHRTGYEAIVDAGFDPVSEADEATLRAFLLSEAVKVKDFGQAYELYALKG